MPKNVLNIQIYRCLVDGSWPG